MDTPYTLRATHLKDLYETITMKTLAKDERLDILLTLKATVRVRGKTQRILFICTLSLPPLFILYFSSSFSPYKEHDCKLTREIVELVDREADLLVRGTKPSALMGMHVHCISMRLLLH